MALKDMLFDCSDAKVQRERVSQTRGPTLRFTGKLIGGYSTRRDEAQTRWQEVWLYQTEAGAMVAVLIGVSDERGEKDLIEATVIEPGDVLAMRIAAMDALNWTVPARELARSLKWKLEREVA